MSNSSLGQRADFRSLFDHLEEVALWTVTEPTEFEYISSGFEDIWGIPPEEVENDVSRLLEGIHPDDRDRVRSLIEQSTERASPESYESRVVQPDGTVRWVQTRHFPIRDEDGNLSEIVGISVDITEQKRREQELEALNRLVRHDIRNDMTVILGWAELLEDHLDDEGKAHLQRILSSGEHVVELTDIARDYVETLTGDEGMPVKPMPLNSTLANELELRRESFPQAEFVVDGELPAVEVRANEMLPSVFRNLLNNAVQHNDSDEPVVTVTCERRNGDVVVSVADNGPGVPDGQKESIFGKGEKGLASPGTGIGLYLVRTLVDQYDGSVWVEDNDPTGSVFNVRLPTVDWTGTDRE